MALALQVPARASSLDDAQAAFDQGDYKNALSMWQRLSSHEPAASYRIGSAYESGSGVDIDYDQAQQWYLKAAEQGYAPAQEKVGSFYHFGLAGRRDDALAAQWQEKAAAQGFAEAEYDLGVYYEQGAGVARDASQAVVWFKRAAQQGHVMALSELATLYATGSGAAKDPVAGMALLNIARGLASDTERDMIDDQIDLLEQQASLSHEQIERAAGIAKQWKKGAPLPSPSP
jgi:TPR repeat protein